MAYDSDKGGDSDIKQWFSTFLLPRTTSIIFYRSRTTLIVRRPFFCSSTRIHKIYQKMFNFYYFTLQFTFYYCTIIYNYYTLLY